MSRLSSGKNAIFIKNESGYKLTRQALKDMSKSIGENAVIAVSDELFPLELLKNTQFYLEKIAFQMCACYEVGLYDASLVMMRKLLETLIIECFERYGNDDEIKDNKGNFLYLSDLSAHNRRFFIINYPHWDKSA